MRYGTELRTGIFRQIKESEAESLEELIDYWWPPILTIMVACIIGAQLPTWMFINSLSLIVHTTLHNTLMPP